MLSVLLEAGGCSSKAIGNPGPDCIYVDQVKATLLQLDGIALNIDERLEFPSAPLLSCVDWFLPSSHDRLESLANLPLFNKLQNMSSTITSPASKKMFFGDSVLRTHKPSPLKGSGAANNGSESCEGGSGDLHPCAAQSKVPAGIDGSGSFFKVLLFF